MQVVGALLHQSRGIGDGGGNIGALRAGHCIKNIDSLVHHKGFAQVKGEKVLMDKGETVVAVQ